ncbi:MAG: hypothetical protein ACTSUV_03985 [Candidatus Ranarchaeia archaeon]
MNLFSDDLFSVKPNPEELFLLTNNSRNSDLVNFLLLLLYQSKDLEEIKIIEVQKIRSNFQNVKTEKKLLDESIKLGIINQGNQFNNTIYLDQGTKIGIIKYLIQNNIELEYISNFINWKDFEKLSSSIISKHKFICKQNFRFSFVKKRFEIDVVAIRKPWILLADAKRWISKSNRNSSYSVQLRKQYQRANHFIKYILGTEKLVSDFEKWKKAFVIPLIIPVYEHKVQIHDNGVIVPIFKLRDFLNNFEEQIDFLPKIPFQIN